jgi:hypothetical protein
MAGNAVYFMDPENAVFKDNGIHGAGLGTDSALIADMDPVIAGRRKPPFNPEQGPGRGDQLKIGYAASQFADPAARAFLMVQ